jgi:hypothetical protein
MNEFEENFNEYDESRRILEIIRESKTRVKSGKKKLMTEEKQPDVINLSEKDPETIKNEEKKFRDIISPRTKFNKFMIYPKTGNVEWNGEFQDSKIQWFYSLDDPRGIYITCDLLRLDDATLDTIKKLVGFYENWADEWANKIADEYRVSDQTTQEGGEEETLPSEGL